MPDALFAAHHRRMRLPGVERIARAAGMLTCRHVVATFGPAPRSMPLKLHTHRRIELRWWWEGLPAGEPRRFRDPDVARHYAASLCAQPELLPALRSFLHQGTPGLWSPLDDAELVDRLATAIAAGRVQVAVLPTELLPSWGEPRQEEAPVAVAVPRAAPLPPPEEICWPCLRAAASARALREASVDGVPFVVQG